MSLESHTPAAKSGVMMAEGQYAYSCGPCSQMAEPFLVRGAARAETEVRQQEWEKGGPHISAQLCS